jgi:hypothetical protein
MVALSPNALYVAGLFLPHTDMTLFPSVAAELAVAERRESER